MQRTHLLLPEAPLSQHEASQDPLRLVPPLPFMLEENNTQKSYP
jgi:hypothetical protein